LDRLAKSALMKRAIILKSKIISWVLWLPEIHRTKNFFINPRKVSF
jgi:hypothetical protein